jgi:hypothetical protein
MEYSVKQEHSDRPMDGILLSDSPDGLNFIQYLTADCPDGGNTLSDS